MERLNTIKELINQGNVEQAIQQLDEILQTDFPGKDEACPLNVIALTKEVNVKGYNYAHQILEDTCNGCASCATVCPDGCISVYKIKVE